jgi:hypothetical protein
VEQEGTMTPPDDGRPVGLIVLIFGVIALMALRVAYGVHNGQRLGAAPDMVKFVVTSVSLMSSLVALFSVMALKRKDFGELANLQTPIVIGLLTSVVFSGFAVLDSFGFA